MSSSRQNEKKQGEDEGVKKPWRFPFGVPSAQDPMEFRPKDPEQGEYQDGKYVYGGWKDDETHGQGLGGYLACTFNCSLSITPGIGQALL